MLAISERIAGVAREDWAKGSWSITVQRTDGRSVTVEAIDPIGSPEKPLSDDHLAAKFRDCARNVVQSVPEATVDAVLGAIARLERLADARELTAPLDG